MVKIPHSASLHSEWHQWWQRGDEGRRSRPSSP